MPYSDSFGSWISEIESGGSSVPPLCLLGSFVASGNIPEEATLSVEPERILSVKGIGDLRLFLFELLLESAPLPKVQISPVREARPLLPLSQCIAFRTWKAAGKAVIRAR